jgi:Protein of unknown function (DUF3499)
VSRQCSRPTCSEPARAGILYDAPGRSLALLDLFDAGPQAIPLCQRHADRLTPPQGWEMTDQRTTTPTGTGWLHERPAGDGDDGPEGRMLRRAFRATED